MFAEMANARYRGREDRDDGRPWSVGRVCGVPGIVSIPIIIWSRDYYHDRRVQVVPGGVVFFFLLAMQTHKRHSFPGVAAAAQRSLRWVGPLTVYHRRAIARHGEYTRNNK